MEWIEVTGGSIVEAEEHALKMLGIERKDAEFEVSEEEKSGIFKRKSSFRVRARVKPRTSSPKSRPRRSNRNSQGSQGNNRSYGGQRKNNNNNNQKRSNNRRDEERINKPLMEKTQQEEILLSFFEGLLKAWDKKGEVVFDWPKDNVCDITVTGKNLDDLVEDGPEVLHALESLARIGLKKEALETRYAQIYLDIAGYRAKRQTALKEFAIKLATEVKESGKTKILEPMDNRDRKIVHDAVGTLEGVITLSEGERANRRVKIFPEGDAALKEDATEEQS